MPRVRSLFSSWQQRPCAVLRCVVMRHAERADADTAWSQDVWAMTTDGQTWPLDPPLSDRGRAEVARIVSSEVPALIRDSGPCLTEESWVVVSSPYFRCVQTAVKVCNSLGPNTMLLIDNQLGEVYGPETMGEIEPTSVVRPFGETWEYCQAHDVRYRSKTVGQWPAWPEYVLQMRTRILSCFLKYLRRSSAARRNFVLVTHADGVAAALAAMPAIQGRLIEKVNFCGFFLASTPFYSSDDTTQASCCCTRLEIGEGDVDDLSPPTSPAALKTTSGWDVKVSGVQLGPRHRRRNLFARLRSLTQRTGFSESEAGALLRCLPDSTMEEVVAYDATSPNDLGQHRCTSPASDDMSWSTYLFGASETASSTLGSHVRGSSDATGSSRRVSTGTIGTSSSSRVDTEIGSPKVTKGRQHPRQLLSLSGDYDNSFSNSSCHSFESTSVGQVSSGTVNFSIALPGSPLESQLSMHSDEDPDRGFSPTANPTLLQRRSASKTQCKKHDEIESAGVFSPVGNSTLLQRRSLQTSVVKQACTDNDLL